MPQLEENDLHSIIIPALEKVLQYLPDKIHARWHYHHMSKDLSQFLIQLQPYSEKNAISGNFELL